MTMATGSAKRRKTRHAGPVVKPSREEPPILLQAASLAALAFKLATRAGGASVKVGRALLASSARDTKMMRETGTYLRDVRELAGLTQSELAEAINLSDHSILAAAEKGTSTLSFELILRLAALLARHDPIPFIMKFTRTYDPEIWNILEKWGVGRIVLQFERERQFINIYREHDAVRKLDDGDFEEVLKFTRAAFEMALHFAAGEQKADAAGGEKKPGKRRKKSPATKPE